MGFAFKRFEMKEIKDPFEHGFIHLKASNARGAYFPDSGGYTAKQSFFSGHQVYVHLQV